MDNELNPVHCGCGGEPKIDHYIETYFVYCKKCQIITLMYDSKEEAVEAWNEAMSGNRIELHTVDTNTIADCCEEVISNLPPIKLSGEVSETKKKIVIENYYKSDITKETSLKEAFTRGFELGLEKAPQKVIEREAKVIIERYKNKSLIDLGVVISDEKFFCSNCKDELEIGYDYCPKCGSKLIWKQEENE